jgi:hypothetical protein
MWYALENNKLTLKIQADDALVSNFAVLTATYGEIFGRPLTCQVKVKRNFNMMSVAKEYVLLAKKYTALADKYRKIRAKYNSYNSDDSD